MRLISVRVEKDSADIKNIHYEGKAAHGALVIVECMSDNPTRTVANVKAIFSKNGGEVLQNGSLGFMFTRKAVFHLEKICRRFRRIRT